MAKLRFVPECDRSLLYEWWHTSRVVSHDRHTRLLWVANEYHKRNPAVSKIAAYKDLCFLTQPVLDVEF